MANAYNVLPFDSKSHCYWIHFSIHNFALIYFFHYKLVLLMIFLKFWVLDMGIHICTDHVFIFTFISGSKMHQLLLIFIILTSRPIFKTGFLCTRTLVDRFYSWAFKSQNTAKKLEKKSWEKWEKWYWSLHLSWSRESTWDTDNLSYHVLSLGDSISNAVLLEGMQNNYM